MAPHNNLRLGVGAVVSFDSKHAHPHKLRDEVLGKDHRMKLEHATVVRRERKTVDHQPTLCVVVQHDKFKDSNGNFQEIYCAESHVHVEKEGPSNQFFHDAKEDEIEVQASDVPREAPATATTADAAVGDDGLAQDLKIEGKPVKGLHFTADYFKWEVLFRSCVQMLFGYILTVAYLPNAVPTSGTYLIGILASTCAVAVPHAMFTITAVYPLLIGMFIL